MLPADYFNPDYGYEFLGDLKPHLYFTNQDDDDVTNYLLESFELTLPRYQLRQRIKNHVDYIDIWDEENGPAPIALFICATTADLLYIKRRIKKQIENSSNDGLVIRVTTLEKIKASGVAGMIWEEV